ncbi:MAG: T9SS type A sorting domain-containing protein [Bacteroidia bacterium]
MKLLRTQIILCCILFIAKTNYSQSHFQLEWQYHYTGFVTPLSLHPDNTGLPYLYVASNEEGLKIMHLNGTVSSVIDTVALQMSVTNFTQVGHLLYLSLGRQNTNDPPGLAIVDVTNPASPVIKDIWVHPVVSGTSGTGIVKVEGNYAYVGAMKLGLIILDISNPANIIFVSETPMNINYPVASPNPNLYNARGMEVKNSIAYICFDAGGLRIMNCTNKSAPFETGHYANPITYVPINEPRAYNNIILNDTVAYVAVDYCGVEVLKINDTSNITLLDNFNPDNCPTGDWHSSPVHANEIEYNDNCKEIFVSTGKSEMMSLDVSDPTNIDTTGMYGSLSDTTATWGIGMRNDSIYLSYILIPIYIPWLDPFDAKWNGIKMIKWLNPCLPASVDEKESKDLFFQNEPNPFSGNTEFHFTLKDISFVKISIYDALGNLVAVVREEKMDPGDHRINYNADKLKQGIYFCELKTDNKRVVNKMVLIK